MFGYVKPLSSELRVREYEYYKAVYCGLCRAMGKKTGCISRLTLSYDFVFLAVIRMALSPASCAGSEIRAKRCFVHPLKKRPYVGMNTSMEYCAKACALLTYGKVRDDISDSGGLKKLSAQALLPAASLMKRRAVDLSELDQIILAALARLHEIESSAVPSIDTPANEFAVLLANVCSFEIDNAANRRIAYEIGYHTGKWIYVTDAIDDYERDLKSGSYNPLVISYNSDGEAHLGDSVLDQLSTATRLELTQLERAVDLIDFSECAELKGIIQNILYLGMPNVTDGIIQRLRDSQRPKNAEQTETIQKSK